MDALEAKKLLLPIPKEDFIIKDFTDRLGKCCAIGHLVRLTSKDPSDYKQDCDDWVFGENTVNHFVRDDVTNFIKKVHGARGNLATVNNNNNVNGYTQDNPKDRVMALLEDMINEEK